MTTQIDFNGLAVATRLTAEHAEVIAQANNTADPEWCYEVVTDPFPHVAVYDADGNHIGNL